MDKCDWCGCYRDDSSIREKALFEGGAVRPVYFCSEKCRHEWREKYPYMDEQIAEHDRKKEEERKRYLQSDQYKEDRRRAEIDRRWRNVGNFFSSIWRSGCVIIHIIEFLILALFGFEFIYRGTFRGIGVWLLIYTLVFVIRSFNENDSEHKRNILLYRHLFTFHLIYGSSMAILGVIC